MTVPDQITLFNALTPIKAGQEQPLTEYLQSLWAQQSLLAGVPSAHFGRWIVIGQPRGEFPSMPARLRRLRMHYLLFTSAFNGPAAQFLTEICTRAGAEADGIWAHCVGYPGHENAAEFISYFDHNRLSIPHEFKAYDHTVADIRAALSLRTKHIEFACDSQTMSPAQLAAEFRARFET